MDNMTIKNYNEAIRHMVHGIVPPVRDCYFCRHTCKATSCIYIGQGFQTQLVYIHARCLFNHLKGKKGVPVRQKL